MKGIDELQVGDTIWVFDDNHRVYTKPQKGRAWGKIIWREHWVPRTIIGETRVSFEYATRGGRKREGTIPKRGPLPSNIALSQQHIDEYEWVNRHKYRLSRDVERITDPATLRKVAEIIGFDESKE